MPYCTLPDKTKLYYEIYGSELGLSTPSKTIIKPTIVGVHGGPSADHTFHVPFFKLLAEQAQVILYDHRGCGRSDGDDPQHWNLIQWATDLNNFCRALHLDKPYIAGISFGGHVALQHAVLHPDQYRGLLLIDTEAFFDKADKVAIYEKAAGAEIAKIVNAYYSEPNDVNTQEFFKHCLLFFTKNPFPLELASHCIFRPNIQNHFLRNVLPHYNLLNKLPIIKSRVLYINGTNNPHHPAEHAKQSAAAFINADLQLHLLEDTGFSTADDPQRVAKIIKDFL